MDNINIAIAQYLFAYRKIAERYPKFLLHFLLLTFVFLIFSSIAALPPYFLRLTANSIGQVPDTERFLIGAAAYAVCWTIASASESVKGSVSAGVLAKASSELSYQIFGVVLKYSQADARTVDSGIAAADIARASNAFASITTSIFWAIFPALIQFGISLLIIAITIGGSYTVALLFAASALLVTSWLVSSRSANRFSQLNDAYNGIQGYMVEKLGLLYDIKIHNAVDFERRLLDKHLQHMVSTVRRTYFITGALVALQMICAGIILTFFSIYGISSKGAAASGGDYAMLAGYIGGLTFQLNVIINSFMVIQNSRASLQNGLQYFRPEENAGAAFYESKEVNTDVLFLAKNISLSIGEELRLVDMSFSIFRDNLTIISGPSGIGKTTLINALLGVVPISKGEIFFRGRPVGVRDGLTTEAIIDNVAVAPQRPQLLNGTLRENIQYAAPTCSESDITAVLRLLELEGLLAEIPEGIDSIKLGVGGRGLSGGELQRLGLARAIVRCKSILILDEPTASIERNLAIRIIKRIRERGNSLIVITHDPAILAMADQTIVLT